jgi:hypothetical protein
VLTTQAPQPPPTLPSSGASGGLPPTPPELCALRDVLRAKMARAEALVSDVAGSSAPADNILAAGSHRLRCTVAFLEATRALPAAYWDVTRTVTAIERLNRLLGDTDAVAPVEPVPGNAPLTALQQASIDNWSRGVPPVDGATASALRHGAARTLNELAGSADGVAAQLPPPDANDPADMLRTAPSALSPIARSQLPPLIGIAPPGHRPVADGAAIMDLAAELGCPACAAGTPCYHVTLAREVDQHRLPFVEPPATPNANKPTYDFDDASWSLIQSHVDKAVDGGAVEALGATPSPDVAHTYSNVFLVRTYDLSVPDADKPTLASPATTEAVAQLALKLATAFMLVFAPAARALMAASLHKSAIAARLAALWDTTMSALHTERKSRLVINLRSHINKRLQDWPFRYASLQEFLLRVRPGGWLAKTDVSAGFHHVRIHPDDVKYLAFRTRAGVYRYLRLPFGLKTAPALFSWLTAAVNDFLRARGVAASMVYIDDFIVYAESEAACRLALNTLKALCERLSIRLDADKTVGPTQRLTVLGIVVDTVRTTVALPPEKLLKTLLYAFLIKRCAEDNLPVPLGPLRKAAGGFARLGLVNPDARPYLRGFAVLEDGAAWPAPSTHDVHVASKPLLLHNVDWLLTAALGGRLNGESLLATPATAAWNVVHVTSDAHRAPGEAGGAARFGRALVAYPFPAPFAALHIGVLELLPPLLFLHHVRELLPGALVYLATDNEGNAYAINSGRARSRDASNMIAALYELRRRAGFEIVATWLTRSANHLCDRLAVCRTQPQALALDAYACVGTAPADDWRAIPGAVAPGVVPAPWSDHDAGVGAAQ